MLPQSGCVPVRHRSDAVFSSTPAFTPKAMCAHAIRHGTFNGACSTMVRRDKTPARGFNPAIPMASDWLYWVETRTTAAACVIWMKYSAATAVMAAMSPPAVAHRLAQTHVDHLGSCQYMSGAGYRLPRRRHARLQPKSCWRCASTPTLPNLPGIAFVLSPSLKGAVRLLLYHISLGKIRK